MKLPGIKLFSLLLIIITFFMSACSSKDPAVELTIDPELNQAIFSSPEIAAQAFTNAVSTRDKDKIGQILGLNAVELLPLKDMKPETIKLYLSAYAYSKELKSEGNEQKILTIGKEGWTLPIPIIKGETGWYFDTVAGKNRIRIRRIGRNELAVMKVALAIHDAQMEYSATDRNGDGYLEYAQKILSTTGTRNGLYWKSSDADEQSPLGSLFSNDVPEKAYHGYYYRILTSQGDQANGGTMNYLTAGRMTKGFALIAWPAEYGNTGVMSFITNHKGIVYQQNLGQDTAETAGNIRVFNPDAAWVATGEVNVPAN